MGRGGLMNAATAAEILAFWFGRPGARRRGRVRHSGRQNWDATRNTTTAT